MLHNLNILQFPSITEQGLVLFFNPIIIISYVWSNTISLSIIP